MLAVLFVLLAVVALVAQGNVYYPEPNMQRFQWQEFKHTYAKVYTKEEEPRRMETFLSNLRLIDARNKEEAAVNGTAIHGINSFADLTREEFKKRFLNLDPSKANNNKATRVEVKKLSDSANADWTGVYTTPVKDQGYCGSCWAFSATEQLESDSMRMLSTEFILAPQQIVSCDTQSFGCGGGWPTWAFDYVMSAGGQEQESVYPYTSGATGATGSCSANAAANVISASQYFQITASSTSAVETAMASYVGSTGPLSICVDANNWSTYKGGIMSKCGNSIDHAVQAVGVNTEEGYWKVRNSWGTSWGEAGYIRLAYGSNTCDLTYMPLYTDAIKATA